MTALRCTQKLLTAMKAKPSAPPAPGANRLGLVLEAAPYANRLSLQANLKDYAWLTEIYLTERQASLAAINARLADNLVNINGKLEFPWKFALNRAGGTELKGSASI